MRTLLAPILVPATLLFALPAHGQVFKCIDADGRITYTNDRSEGRGCTPLSQDQPVSSVPAPRAPGAKPPQAAASPSAFPRVTPDAQRARDDTRRQILEKELSSEQGALEEAQKALSEQEAGSPGDEDNLERALDRLQPYKDRVELHQRNIEALQREIANLR